MVLKGEGQKRDNGWGLPQLLQQDFICHFCAKIRRRNVINMFYGNKPERDG